MTPLLQHSARLIAAAAGLGTLLLTGGCASTPSSLSSASSTRQLILTMTVAGVINPNDYYFVFFNTSNDQSGAAGPDPPIAANWGGNGFVTGEATQYVEYNGSITGDGYAVGNFNVVNNDNLQLEVPNNVPISDTPVVAGSSTTLQFRIPLADLETSTYQTVDSIKYIQINFINTNQQANTTLNQLSTPKLFDALGNTTNLSDLNHYITIPVTQDGTYSNNTAGLSIEPSSQDVAATTGNDAITTSTDADAANLDIRSWSVQVTS